MRINPKGPQAANQVGSTGTSLAIVKHGLIINDGDFEITAGSISTTDYPHKLKSAQIKELNKVVSTISKYESVIDSLAIISKVLFDDFLNSGQDQNTEKAKVYKNILDLYHALLPASDDGWYNGVERVLYGKWNSDLKAYERYR